MPTTYAHYKFGQAVLARLIGQGKEEVAVILENKPLYDIGLHGPDLLFYYKALKSNPVSRLGNAVHKRSGYNFFHRAGDILLAQDYTDFNIHLAYLYGFICHFALDSECHEYIDRMVEEIGVSHLEMEAEFDAYLMKEDGYDPLSKIVTSHVNPTERSAQVIRDFYPRLSAGQVYEAEKSFVFFLDMLVAPGDIKRNTILTAMKAAGVYDDLHGLMINKEPNSLCDETNEELEKRFDTAADKAVRLIGDYLATVTGDKAWDEAYRYNFNGIKVV